jgi:nucleoside-diphosphate-sugar epimerase
MRITLIGAQGFVGSAFARLLSQQPVELLSVTRQNYDLCRGQYSDVTIEASCNSKKYLADAEPLSDFQASVTHRLQTLLDFPAALHIHISSVDVYRDLTTPERTSETEPLEPGASRYGVHKGLAEQLVRHYAQRWLIVRLAGMVGPGLRKNPVYDILHGQPLRIHPDSQYQFMHTDDVARLVWWLYESGQSEQVFNLCGEGLISPRRVAELAGRPLDLSLLRDADKPRLVDINVDRFRRLHALPRTEAVVAAFVKQTRDMSQNP